MNTGDRIKDLRKEKKLTQEELAEKSGVSLMSIRRYEKDNKKYQVDTLAKIANALDTDVNALLGWDHEIKSKEDADAFRRMYKEQTGGDFPEVSREEISILAQALDYMGEYMNSRPELQGIIGKEAFQHLRTDEGKEGLEEYISSQPDKREQLLAIYDTLNDAGQSEAVKDVEKLAKIPEYQKKE